MQTYPRNSLSRFSVHLSLDPRDPENQVNSTPVLWIRTVLRLRTVIVEYFRTWVTLTVLRLRMRCTQCD
jgi:hypothetical protein